jgi:sugar lactone lactonase YvrE
VDDAFTSHDGRVVYVSRPSLADVVAISLRTHNIVWRTPVEGYRADHMAISPDGTRLLVSASTARKVHVIDTKTGRIVGNFESGDQPTRERGRPADGAVARRALRLLPALLPARLRRVRPQARPAATDRRGTMSDYAAIVGRRRFVTKVIPVGDTP